MFAIITTLFATKIKIMPDSNVQIISEYKKTVSKINRKQFLVGATRY